MWEKIEEITSLQKKPILWIHVASLGEFEQTRPLLQLLRKNHSEFSLLVSFFSPSGYKVRANYEHVDGVVYLPLDFPRQMRRFLRRLKPVLGLLVKYEFWPNMCYTARQECIPLLSLGADFRVNQMYFRRSMGFFRRTLYSVSAFLVQDVSSARLLRSINCQYVEAVGDPRYDGVQAATEQEADFPLISRFKG